MPLTWPAILPEPDFAHEARYTSGLIDPQSALGAERNRRLPDKTDAVRWLFESDQMAAFKAFYDDDCLGGARAFCAAWLASLDPDAKWARFAGPYESAPEGLHWRVTAELELIR